jgi:hypothetical protein
VRGVHPVLTVTIDGNTSARMLIDTGTSNTVLAPGLAWRGSLADICLTPTVCVKNLPVYAYASAYSNANAGYYNGVIGWDILSKLVTTIDYAAATVTFGSTAGGTILPFTLDSTQRPHAAIAIGGTSLGTQLLDTGSSYTRLTDAQNLTLATPFVANGTELSVQANSVESTTLSTPMAVCAGAVCASAVVVQKANWSALGGSFFREFVLTIDGPGGVFRFTPAKIGPLVSGLLRYGLQISPNDATEIVLVRPGSIADAADVQTIDRVQSVNGTAVASLGYLGFMAVLDDAATRSVRLNVQGLGPARDVVLSMP